MERKNCWEVKRCGREQGGKNSTELGICPAAMPSFHDGLNRGEYSGRSCWLVAGTFCNGEIQGTYAVKLSSCMYCEHMISVTEEEGRRFMLTPSQTCE